jgi:arylsulfatase A-like enzyme
MKMHKLVSFLGGLLLWMSFSSHIAFAQNVSGQVLNPQGGPALGARVIVEDALRGTVTQAEGRFLIPNLIPGEYVLEVEAFGARKERLPIVVTKDGLQNVVVRLRPNDLTARQAAAYQPPQPERMAQKRAYLDQIRTLPKTKTPNIIVIIADDLGYGDLGIYGNRLIRTPHIDQLARRGVRMSQAYASSPVCTPSRSGLMTGRYPVRAHAGNHVFFPEGSSLATFRAAINYPNALIEDEILLPEILQSGGWRTGLFGKWHLGAVKGSRPRDRGFDEYYGIYYSNDGPGFEIWRNDRVEVPNSRIQQGLLSQLFTDEAIAFVKDPKSGEKPFFLYLAYSAPHVPHVANPANSGTSRAGLYGDIVEDMDANVGRLMQALKEVRADRNTIIIFTSDNGADVDGSAGALRGRKSETLEGGMRVPFIVSAPGQLPTNTVRDAMSMNIDVMPTLLTLIGLPQPQDRIIDGRNIWPALKRNQPSPHDRLFYFGWWWAQIEAVRDASFKYRDRPVIASINPLYPLSVLPPRRLSPMLHDLRIEDETFDVSAQNRDAAARLEGWINAFRQDLKINLRGWLPAPEPQEVTKVN